MVNIHRQIIQKNIADEISYFPWSEEVLNRCLKKFKKNKIPILDLESSARCDHNSCIYCDSRVGKPHSNELDLSEFIDLIKKGKRLGLEWVFICGLGEPTDDPHFVEFVQYLAKENIKIFIFTNGIGFDEDFVRFLHSCNVNINLKLDSFKAEVFDKILEKKGAAKSIYTTLNHLLEVGYGKIAGKSCTNLALSIVPTIFNIDEIPEIVDFCKKNNIYPSIGELELSGKAIKIYDDIRVPIERLFELKEKIDKILGYDYRRPICPAALCSLHINNRGKCVVHTQTGLSCHWFLLGEPNEHVLGDIRIDSLESLNLKMRKYRGKKLKNIATVKKSYGNHLFGGCGGNANKLLTKYLEISQIP